MIVQHLQAGHIPILLSTILSIIFLDLLILSRMEGCQGSKLSKPSLTRRPIKIKDFTYQHLADGEFRLLAIEPADNIRSPLKARLTHASMTTPPSYHALSYTWGPPDPALYMLCEGSQMRITKSLHDALCQLRRRDEAITVWADAVCINQVDDAEKSRQVALMREIYARASFLFIWFGHPAQPDDAGLAFEALGTLEEIFLRHAGADHLRLPWPEEHGARYAEWGLKADEDIIGSPDIRAEHWEALGRFYLAPWFSRVWIFQEAVSFGGDPASHMTVAYGARRLSWDTFAKVTGGLSIFSGVLRRLTTAAGLATQDKFPWFIVRAIQLDRNSYTVTVPVRDGVVVGEEEVVALLKPGQGAKLCALVSVEFIHSEGGGEPETGAARQGSMRRVIELVRDSAAKLDLAPVRCTIKFTSDCFRTTGGINSFLFHHLNLGRRLFSTDPRDKLFAFYGILQDDVGANAFLVPNYGKSVVDVYIDITLYFIQRESCLDIFELLYDQPRGGSMMAIAGLPSWANDWTQTAELEKFHTTDFSAGGSNYLGMSFHAQNLRLSDDRRRLGLQVYPVGTIYYHVPPQDEYTYEYIRSMTESGNWPYEHRQLAADMAKEAGILEPMLDYIQYIDCLGRIKLLESTFTSAFDSSEDMAGLPPPSKIIEYYTGETLYETFWRTLVCNLDKEGARAGDWVAEAFQAYHDAYEHLFQSDRTVDISKEQSELSRKFQMERDRYTRRRRFCVANTGFIGWAPRRAAVGDTICVIPGARTPYVIRESCEEKNEWEIIGHAYVHGLMENVVEDKDVGLTEKGREYLGQDTLPIDIWLV